MRVVEAECRTSGEWCEVRAQVICEPNLARNSLVSSKMAANGPWELRYRFPAEFADFANPENGDPFVVPLLAPAMAAGEPLHLGIPVSARLESALDDAQRLYNEWYPSLYRVEVDVPVRRDPLRVTREPQSVGLFFSLGVDSFYSLLKNLGEDAATGEEITHLVLGRGLDVSLERGNSAVFPKVLAHGREVARQVGKKLLPIASNVREFTTQFADWAEVTHGAAMAGMALSLEAMFAQVLIAATHTHDNLFSWGSHPHLDPLWSTETLSFVHDGCEATRLDKMRVLAISRVALQHLRVCLTNTGNQYNCGRCEKCLRTMLGLHVIDALRPCTTLPDVIDPSHLQDVTIDGHVDRHYREVLPLLGSSAEDRAIRDAVERLLRHVTPKRVAPAILGEET